MNVRNIMALIVGLLAGFLAGFGIANKLPPASTAFQNTSTAQPTAGQTQQSSDAVPRLSEEEIRGAIAAADADAANIDLQRKLAVMLYAYASQTRETRYHRDVERLLKRVHEANPKDVDAIIALGNVNFDLGQNEDSRNFIEARRFYQLALKLKPDDPNLLTDVGLTYYFAKPPNPTQSIAEFRKALEVDPKHEVAMQSLSFALIDSGETSEGEKRISELEKLNPSNAALPNLRAQLAQSKNKAQVKR